MSTGDKGQAGKAGASEGDRDVAELELQLFELRHRTKNLLAIVQSLVNQTLRGDVSIDDARKALSERLVSMGGAVDLLMGYGWQPAPMVEVLKKGLVHETRYGRRISMEGPPLAVEPGAAMSLSLALHELESNAIKYGALSAEGGAIRIEWRVEHDAAGDRLLLQWAESGGPPVAEPQREGFGTRLLSKAIGRRLGGTTVSDFRPDGFRWTLSAPLSSLS